ncbi:hypothetical protein DFJ77DRAFT_512898 [Powellomyces hirtus]|nr:hypothetical protein DFJ77DRAFT_512898 [Powellomyces hirtus]
MLLRVDTRGRNLIRLLQSSNFHRGQHPQQWYGRHPWVDLSRVVTEQPENFRKVGPRAFVPAYATSKASLPYSHQGFEPISRTTPLQFRPKHADRRPSVAPVHRGAALPSPTAAILAQPAGHPRTFSSAGASKTTPSVFAPGGITAADAEEETSTNSDFPDSGERDNAEDTSVFRNRDDMEDFLEVKPSAAIVRDAEIVAAANCIVEAQQAAGASGTGTDGDTQLHAISCTPWTPWTRETEEQAAISRAATSQGKKQRSLEYDITFQRDDNENPSVRLLFARTTYTHVFNALRLQQTINNVDITDTPLHDLSIGDPLPNTEEFGRLEHEMFAPLDDITHCPYHAWGRTSPEDVLDFLTARLSPYLFNALLDGIIVFSQPPSVAEARHETDGGNGEYHAANGYIYCRKPNEDRKEGEDAQFIKPYLFLVTRLAADLSEPAYTLPDTIFQPITEADIDAVRGGNESSTHRDARSIRAFINASRQYACRFQMTSGPKAVQAQVAHRVLSREKRLEYLLCTKFPEWSSDAFYTSDAHIIATFPDSLPYLQYWNLALQINPLQHANNILQACVDCLRNACACVLDHFPDLPRLQIPWTIPPGNGGGARTAEPFSFSKLL